MQILNSGAPLFALTPSIRETLRIHCSKPRPSSSQLLSLLRQELE